MAKKRLSVDKNLTTEATGSADASVKAPAKAPSANVIWRDKKEPPASIMVGHQKIALPDAATQKKGFYHAEAAMLRRLKNGYKEFKPKG